MKGNILINFILEMSKHRSNLQLRPCMLCCGIIGQQDDARMCLSIALTAAKLGGAIVNYIEVTELIKAADGMVAGARVKDCLTGTDTSTLHSIQELISVYVPYCI